jgi:hypothetical protein
MGLRGGGSAVAEPPLHGKTSKISPRSHCYRRDVARRQATPPTGARTIRYLDIVSWLIVSCFIVSCFILLECFILL